MKDLLKVEQELEAYRKEILANLKGLGQVPYIGWANPLTLLFRRKESYLLGELRGAIITIDMVTGLIDKHKLRDKA